MSIQDKITRLQAAKTNIADAITAKGGTVAEGDGFEEFSSDIGTISSGITVNESYDISEGTLNHATVTLEGDVVANIPDGVTILSGRAFDQNKVITKVIMPNSVISIGDYAPWDSKYGAFYSCTALTDVHLSNNLETIGSYAFANCIALTNIIIPDSVRTIKEYAFHDTHLTDIYYTGTQAEWEQIALGAGAIPESTTIHYEYVPD